MASDLAQQTKKWRNNFGVFPPPSFVGIPKWQHSGGQILRGVVMDKKIVDTDAYQVEGLLLAKMPYQDRHVLGRVLLRSGKKISIIFYGGQGASGDLELGYLLQMQLQRPGRRPEGEIWGCRQWQLGWYHRQLRQNYRSFALACFYLEVINYCAVTSNLLAEDDRQVDLFKVASNAIYYLDCSGEINHRWHQCVFLAKLLQAQGIFPQLDYCLLDESSLSSGFSGQQCRQLRIDQGGFVAATEGDDSQLWHFFQLVQKTAYRELLTSVRPFGVDHQKIWAYLCYHLPLEQHQIKSYKSLFDR